mgnify:CR=1 FL=1
MKWSRSARLLLPKANESPGHTGLSVWGSNGNEAQHSFYQWLREGTGRTSIDIIWSEMPGHRYAEHYRVLLANARAQAEALVMRDPASPYFNAVSTIVFDAVTPRRLGAFMAMYEHKTTILARFSASNPFDQPGVELGKRLSKRAEAGGDPARIPSGRGGSAVKILIVKSSSMGDIIHALPVAHDIRKLCLMRRLIGSQRRASKLSPTLAPAVRRVHVTAFRRWRKSILSERTRSEVSALKAAMRGEHYDVVLDIQGSCVRRWLPSGRVFP